jgi:predicted ATPase/transcriptional regulator with XRE-family HTH domain
VSNTDVEFSALLRRFRAERGLTQEALAERAGLSARGISDLERGTRRVPHRSTIDLLSAALALSENERAAFIEAAGKARRADGAAHANYPGRLPAFLTPILGREVEVTGLLEQISSPDGRLTTITGFGGIGKTRLATAVAEAAQRGFGCDVVFVPLAGLTKASDVPMAVADAFGLRDDAARNLEEALAASLADRNTLLVLDSFEHVIDAAPIAISLLQYCDALRILCTSRVRLRVRGEREFLLSPLELDVAIDLFHERAIALGVGYQPAISDRGTVGAICERLDRLPLAIELAVGRMRLLSPSALLARLDRRLEILSHGPFDAPLRQRTLSATIAWSYDHLDVHEQRLLRELAIFPGGCSLQLAIALSAQDLESGTDFLDRVTSLVEHNLLLRDERAAHDGDLRLRMFDTIREFAMAKSDELQELESIRARAIEVLSAFAELSDLRGHEQGHWIHALEAEHDNLRWAIDSSIDKGDLRVATRLVSALWLWFYWARLGEGLEWTGKLLAADSSHVSASHGARLLFTDGLLAWHLGDTARGKARLGEAVAAYRQLDDPSFLALSLVCHSQTFWQEDDVPIGLAARDEGIALARRIGDRWVLAGGLLIGSLLEDEHAGRTIAVAMLREAESLYTELGDWRMRAFVTWALGLCAFHAHDLSDACSLYERSLETFREYEDTRAAAMVLGYHGRAKLEMAENGTAKESLVESLQLAQQVGDRRTASLCLEGLAKIASLSGDLSAAERLGVQATSLTNGASMFLPPRDPLRPTALQPASLDVG